MRTRARAVSRARGRAGVVLAAVATMFVAVPAVVAEAQTVSPAVTVMAPADAATDPGAYFVGVSCTSVGTCTAVGRYKDSAGRQQPMVGAETNGVWARGTAVTLPSDAGSGSSVFNGVSCSSAGNCAAVGEYRDNTGARQAMTAAEVDGIWAQAAKLNLPTGAIGGAVLTGVSCTSVGNCVTAGNYTDTSGYQQAMVATETSGAWGQAAKVTPPSGASTNVGAFLGPVSCTSVGNCVSVGDYLDGSNSQQGMTATMSDGVWGQAAKVIAPGDAATSADVALLGVSCPSAGNCSAAGYYKDSSDSRQPLTVDEVNGTWAQAAKVASPADARTTSPRAFFNGRSSNVSCWSAGNCIAVGGYYDVNGLQNMTATQTNGTWAPAVKSTLPADAAINPDAGFSAVSCVAGGACTAAGDYRNSSGNYNAQAANVIGDQAVNDAPSAGDDSYSTAEDTTLTVPGLGVLDNDSDVDGDTLTASLVVPPTHGTLELNEDGSFSYTPDPDFHGSDSFKYVVITGTLKSNLATVSLTVTPVNDAPTVTVTPGSCMSDKTAEGVMVLTLTDVDTAAAGLMVRAASSNTALVSTKSLVITGTGGSRALRVTAVEKKKGSAIITVTVNDGNRSSAASVQVLVGTSNAEIMSGTTGVDALFGLAGANALHGLGGADLLCGGSGNDSIEGGDGNDVLSGGSGNDRLIGGPGADVLTGGSGADFFSGGAGPNTFTDYTVTQGDTQG